jgi:hypothetical protein
MTSFWLLLILLPVVGISLYFRYRRKPHDYEWRRVPRPNWRSCRGGRDYF